MVDNANCLAVNLIFIVLGVFSTRVCNIILKIYLIFQERSVGNANGTGPLDNMRNLEHYLNDIMRGGSEAQDHHLKGKNKQSFIVEINDSLIS